MELRKVQKHPLCRTASWRFPILEPNFPQTFNEDVNYGSNENVCLQVQVGWAPKALEFLMDFPNISALANWKDRITPADYGPTEYPAKNGLLVAKHLQSVC